MMETAEPRVHQGRNIKRFREMCGLKQEALALELGDDWNQKRISLLEAKEEIEPEILKQVAEVLKMPVEAFTKLDDDGAINIIANTVTNHDQSALVYYHPVINPMEKWLEALEEIKKLNNEKIELYERMLKDKNEMIERLQKLITEKKS